ncbi:competence type IV pilus minor pilin ComGF [Niallia taxi]|uniref:competence type IV pilus minor pilin ComGF n=1 Tax=Niallia taxi TaxID=2499688 RepID=UPI003981D735
MWMYLRKHRQSVKIVKGEKGFLLTEMLVALSLFLVFCAFFPLAIKLTTDGAIISSSLRSLEWDVFLHQLKKEVRLAESVRVTEQKLHLTVEEENIHYELYGNKIRRRVNGTGHEVCLQEVKAVKFEAIQNGVMIAVTDSLQIKREAAVYSFLRLAEESPL